MATTATAPAYRADRELRRRERPLELAHDGRSQADRHALPLHLALLLPRRRHRGADHPRAARAAEQARRVGGDVQPAVHDARHDHDLPRDHAAVGRVLQLHRSRCRSARATSPSRGSTRSATGSSCSAASSSTRRGSSAPRRTAAGSATRRSPRMQFSPGLNIDFWVHRPADPRRLLARGGVQLHHDDHQHARAGHEPDAHADVHLERVRHAVPDHARLPGHHDRARLPAVRPLLRHALLRRSPPAPIRSSGSTCSGSSATPRSTSSSCRRSGSSPRSSRPSRASRSSATR